MADGPGFGDLLDLPPRAGRVRVEVEDEGGPWGPGGGQNGQSGRGLAIVGQLASRWGRDDRRTVWFEIDW